MRKSRTPAGPGSWWRRIAVASVTFGVLAPSSAGGAERLILDAAADVWVSEFNRQQNTNDIPLLQAGIGRGRAVGRLLSYVRFDLRDVPLSGLFRTTKVIQAHLTLFAQSSGLAGETDELLVSVAGCADNAWSERTMTWDNRVCPDVGQADDMRLLEVAELPRIYRWDVTRSLAQTVRTERTRTTFILSAFKAAVRPGAREIVPGRRFGSEASVGFIRFWSRERAALGARAAPTLVIAYEREDTNLVRFAGMVLAILSALSVAFGVWEGVHRMRAR